MQKGAAEVMYPNVGLADWSNEEKRRDGDSHKLCLLGILCWDNDRRLFLTICVNILKQKMCSKSAC